MIINSLNNVDFLHKNTQIGGVSEEDITNLWSDISTYMNDNVDITNDINNSVLKLLDSTAKKSQDALNRLTLLSSELASLYAISGRSNTSLSPFDTTANVVSEGINIDKDLYAISLGKEPSGLYTPQSIKVIQKNASLGNSMEYDILKYSDINNLIGTHSRLEIESIGSDMICSILIDLGEEKPLNNVSFNMTNFGVRLPKIDSIEISSDGFRFTSQTVLVSNDASIDLDSFNFTEDAVSLDISEARGRYVRINITQSYPYGVDNSSRYAIGMNSLSVAFLTSQNNGSTTIGPFKSPSPILKASIAAEIQKLSIEDDNVRFQISNDGVSWYELENSKIYNPDSSKPKVINFNTKDENSVTTEDPVRDLYLKISMDSIDSSYLSGDSSKVSRYRGMITSSDRELFTGTETGETDVFEVLGTTYGAKSTFAAGLIVANSPLISEVRLGNRDLIRSVGPSDYINSIDISGETISTSEGTSMTIYTKDDNINIIVDDNINGIMLDDFDPYKIKLFGLSKPLFTPVEVTSRDGQIKMGDAKPILSISDPHGLYYIHIGEKSISIDLSRGYFNNNSELIFIIPEEVTSVDIYDEIGGKYKTVETVLINELNILFLGDVFDVSYPSIEGLTYNKHYPLVPLKSDEFSLSLTSLRLGSYYKGKAIIPRVISNHIEGLPVKNIDGTSRLVLSNNKQIKAAYSLDNYDLKRVAKLKNTNVINGTVRFDISNASINSFIKEVGYIDGITEFQLSEAFSQLDNYNKNIVQLNSNYIDDGRLAFAGASSVFTNRVYSEDELIDSGDWMVDLETSRILLPDGTYTSDIVDVEISYSIDSGTISTSGLYSIDYKRGIVHTVAPIDHRIIIHYQYSSVFASYEALSRVEDSNVSINPGVIAIENATEDKEYLAIIKSSAEESKSYNVSPIITDIKINTITEEDFI